MNLKTKYIIILSLICLFAWAILGFIFLTEQDDTNRYATDISTESHFVDTTDNSVTYYEKDDDLTYNYITNPQIFELYDNLPYIYIQSIGDKINNYLQDAGYKYKQLKIIEHNTDGVQITLTLSISDSTDTLCALYDFFTDEYRFFIVKN